MDDYWYWEIKFHINFPSGKREGTFTVDRQNAATSKIAQEELISVYKDNPLNFEWIRGFARTQDLRPIKTFNYAMMGWSRSMINVLKKGQLFDEDTQLIESSKWSSFLLKNHHDLEFIKILFNVAPDQGK